jgi:glycosyltransferase involved in cell wall biosynthesis
MRISAIVNCSYEGLLLQRSIESAIRSIEASGFAEQCELVAVADNATEGTLGVLRAYGDKLSRVLETDVADLGAARNAGVQAARGELVLFLDGDDLWCRNWVAAAWAEYEISAPLTILHPQLCVFFGAKYEILVHPDWRDAYFDPRGLVARNHWTSLCGVGRQNLVSNPFPMMDATNHFGFEDWSWYAQAIARGFRHAIVPGTSHFIRVKFGDSMQKSIEGFFRIPSVEFSEYLAGDDITRPYDL